MTIAIDFDGTCVAHNYPQIGADIGAVPVLKELVENGHGLILFTMRSGRTLMEAIQWFIDHEIKLYGIQFDPNQCNWTGSNKCYAPLYIDDAAMGAYLRTDTTISHRPFLDWEKARLDLVKRGLIKTSDASKTYSYNQPSS